MALSASIGWDVRTTGNDSNGGAFKSGATGTDYSVQDSPQVTYTDLVIGGTNTQLTSAAFPFSSVHVGNVINITGGSGFTTGRYEVVSVAGSTATMDRAVGTASSTGGAGRLGGGMLTIAAAVSAAVSLNYIYIKSGTYTHTSSVTFPSGKWLQLYGYNANHSDLSAKPTITTSTASMNQLDVQSGSSCKFTNLRITNTAGGVRWAGVAVGATDASVVVDSCAFDGCGNGIWTNNGDRHVYVINTEIKNSAAEGILHAGRITVYGCYIHHNTTVGLKIQTSDRTSSWVRVTRSIISYNGTTTTDAGISMPNDSQLFVEESVLAHNLGDGVDAAGNGGHMLSIENSIIYGNGGYGIDCAASPYFTTLKNNAYGANTAGNKRNVIAGLNEVALTASPFTNAAFGDFSLNATAGGGAACKGVGLPGAFPGGTTTGTLDIGAAQSGGAGGGGGLKRGPDMMGGIHG